jgi:hypothetical protein
MRGWPLIVLAAIMVCDRAFVHSFPHSHAWQRLLNQQPAKFTAQSVAVSTAVHA